jgi:hypothetical protein
VEPIVSNEDIKSGKQPAALAEALAARLVGLPPTKKTEVLKAQIELYVYGMGFRHLRPKSFSSGVNPAVGKPGSQENIDFLMQTLMDIFAAIRKNNLVLLQEAFVPGPVDHGLPSLGGMSVQRTLLEADIPTPMDLEAVLVARPPRKRRARSKKGEPEESEPEEE